MKRGLFAAWLALAACVTVTTRANITIGAGGRAELGFAVDGADTLRITNTGPVAVQVFVDFPRMPQIVPPGETFSWSIRGEARLIIANRFAREASVVVETRSAVRTP